MSAAKHNILVTGANGYVGSRLLETLLERGYSVRAMVRDASTLPVAPRRDPDVVEADVLKPETLPAALEGITDAYYLIHSLKAGHDSFVSMDKEAAGNFAAAAEKAGVQRVFYLGGLGDDDDAQLSDHLKSRQDTGVELRKGSVPVTEFRAGSIIGSGSFSFEILRYLSDRLPVMITPRWLETRTQPVAIRDVLEYLIQAIELPETAGNIYEIGCPEVLTYKEMMIRYAKIRGLRRFIIPVPLLTPYLSSLWISLVTPLPKQVARSLVEGLRNDMVVRSDEARRDFDIEPTAYDEAVKLAIQRSQHWVFLSDDIPHILERRVRDKGRREIIHSRGYIIEKRIEHVAVPPEKLFAVIKRIGGKNGWPYADGLWKFRYFLDRLIGSTAKPRRRDADELMTGDPVDFWTVERYDENRRLLLRNEEMKIPGKAWLRFAARKEADGMTRLTMTAFFEPRGAFGVVYWYTLYPLHTLIFGKTLGRIIEKARQETAEPLTPPGEKYENRGANE